jgi:putative NADH-flavin reductase
VKIAILGATGRTGALVLKHVLDAGHHARVLVRSPGRLGVSHPHLEALHGDAREARDVARLVAGCDGVISAIGPVDGHNNVCSVATENVIAAAPPRYVVVSGAALDVPGDDKNLADKAISFVVRALTLEAFRDKVHEHALLEASGLAWTALRPPRLTDEPAEAPARASLERLPGNSVSREALAAFALAALTDDTYLRKAPFVAA